MIIRCVSEKLSIVMALRLNLLFEKVKIFSLKSIINLLFLFFFTAGYSQNNFFLKTRLDCEIDIRENDSISNSYKFDYSKLSTALTQAFKTKKDNTQTILVGFPDERGNIIDFLISERSIMDEEQQKKYPDIRSYFGYNIKNPSIKISFSLSPYKGLSGIMIHNGEFVVYEPYNNTESFKVLEKKNIKSLDFNNCLAPINLSNLKDQEYHKKQEGTTVKKKYTIAISTTSEYSNFHGNTFASVNAAIVATLTNVNAIFENDLNISFQLASNNDSILFLDPDNDPYLDSEDYGESLQNILDSKIGDSNYSIGHLFQRGGISGNSNCIGCVCESGLKGKAYSSSNHPTGYFFDYNLVAHEIGHQFGANHTWSNNGNEGTGVQVEPGSGSTIMGYAGISNSANVELNNSPYFHGISISQIQEYSKKISCGEFINTTNTKPIVKDSPNIILPISTPFKLEGFALDNDGDDLTYCWEQINDSNGRYIFPDPQVTNSNAVLCRSYLPSKNNMRYIPNLDELRYGLNKTKWEKVPNVGRKANFRLTVRDNNVQGGFTNYDDVEVIFDKNYGPFEFSSFNNKSIFLIANSNQTVSWNVNKTNQLQGGKLLKLLLSVDGGLKYDYVIADNIPNNGSFQFKVPNNIIAKQCRFLLEANGGHFFAINKEDFSIGQEVINTCKKYESSPDLSLPINHELPDSKQINSIIIEDSGIISDVNIAINLFHEQIKGLEIFLESPYGTKVELKSFGSCGEENSLIGFFDDEAVSFDCSNSSNNFRYRPQKDALALLNGEDMKGKWNLIVKDNQLSYGGVLNSWSIEFCEKTVKEAELSEDSLNAIVVFPNPNDGNFIVSAPALHSINQITMELFDSIGRLILKKLIKETNYLNEPISLNNLQSGLYVLKVTDGDKIISKKIIIK
ncbi:T9SS C-terminal target domain-containing protein [Lutibacter sp. HS1-25]|uniref:reprolysin-like metallopeptidase n=1 Tax=Lutibacter sp. HS1-25 TaxID=2485000 RepID=UPI001012D5FB|nr:zinc-dependent metalloprotease family protein [Lutibacter sp. HS1-25]RXP46464.1 T9SS C-terminal target domain-containing protein [Lutibacter sp. HS1-25]